MIRRPYNKQVASLCYLHSKTQIVHMISKSSTRPMFLFSRFCIQQICKESQSLNILLRSIVNRCKESQSLNTLLRSTIQSYLEKKNRCSTELTNQRKGIRTRFWLYNNTQQKQSSSWESFALQDPVVTNALAYSAARLTFTVYISISTCAFRSS